MKLTREQQLAGLTIVTCLQDLFTYTKKPTFTREEILIALDKFKELRDLFDPAIVELYEANRK